MSSGFKRVARLTGLTEADATRIMLLGPIEAIRQTERDLGHEIILVGQAPWLSKFDWPDNVCVSRNGGEIRLVAINARQPGRGALSRLMIGIIEAGLVPVVVEPMLDMPPILERWGFRDRGNNEWVPPEGWLKEPKHG